MLKKICNKLNRIHLKIKGAKVPSSAIVDFRVEIAKAKGINLSERSILYKNSTIYNGKNGFFKMGNDSHCAPFGYFLIGDNKVDIGSDVAIGPNCSFICHSNSIEGKSELFRENYLDGDIFIGNNVFIGAQCTFLPGTIIPDNVVIASNSVVKGQLESGNVYGGSPAKLIKAIA